MKRINFIHVNVILAHPFHILFLAISFLNAILRTSVDSDITLFRVILPFAVMAAIFTGDRVFVAFCAFASFFLLSQFVSFFFGKYHFSYVNFSFIGNYLTMFFFAAYILYLYKKWGLTFLLPILIAYNFILVIDCILQFLIGFHLPNVNDTEGVMNAWYTNENDLSLALAAFIFLVFRFKLATNYWLLIIISTFIIYINGSRGNLLPLGILYLYELFVFLKSRNNYLIASVVCFSCGCLFLLILIGNTLSFLDFFSDLIDFSYQLLEGIQLLYQYDVNINVVGSMEVRAAAAYLAFNEFFKSPLFGIGAGSSILMMKEYSYLFDDGIKSTHNMPLMFLLEMGTIFFLFIIVVLKRLTSLSTPYFLFWFILFLLASLSPSGGFIVNFYTLTCFIVVLCAVPSVRSGVSRRVGDFINAPEKSDAL